MAVHCPNGIIDKRGPRSRGDIWDDLVVAHLLPAASVYRLTVVAVADVGARMRRITLHSDELASFVAIPGQDVAVHLADPRGGGVSRRYTIRHLDRTRCRFDLDVVTHGDGPGARWGVAAAIGDTVEVFGPRGKVMPSSAGWQLFMGDESTIAAIAEMVAVLPPDVEAQVTLEVTDTDDEQPMAGERVEVNWLHRGSSPPEGSRLLDEALRQRTLPGSDRHVYLFGESRVVRRLRDQLYERGLGVPEISAKGYWNAGRPASA
jgi:NADPH-dependent ferric siderophore reductase